MIPLFTKEEFENVKPKMLLPLQCENCGSTFFKKRSEINKVYNNSPSTKCAFCSIKCRHENRITTQDVTCINCDKIFKKLPNQIKKFPNHFCSSSCAATYNNKHKTCGNKRSKLEIWLEEQLTNLYPSLKILYNNKEAINSELDIYIPSFKLAFELNGIFHYEPIYGADKLQKIQNNDERKFQACLENQIEFVLIDVSVQKYFKPKTSEKFLNIIIKIIDEKLNISNNISKN